MECEVVMPVGAVNLAIFRKVQISLMSMCILCYGILTVKAIFSYSPESHEPLLIKCASDYHGFAERYMNSGTSREDIFNTVNNTTSCPCLKKTCVPKCCPSHQSLYSASGMTCVVSSSNLVSFSEEISNNFTIYHTILPNQTVDDLRSKNVTPSDVHTFAGRSVCKSGQSFKIRKENNFLLEDGTVLSESSLTDLDEYCVEFVDDKLEVFTTDGCADGWTRVASLIANTFRKYHLIDIERHTSCVLIFFTIFTYLYLAELRNFHGKKLVCYLTSLGAQIFISVLQDSYGYNNSVLQHIWYISITSQYLWLTSMCFDLWSVFSRPLQAVHGRSTENTKLIIYCFYSWALPSLSHIYYWLRVTEMAESPVCTELHFKEDLCETSAYRLVHIFYLLPIYLQASLNLVMFLSTLVNLRLHSRRSTCLSGADSRRHSQAAKDGLRMYIKLSLVMGLPYTLNTLLFVVNPEMSSLLSVVRNILLNICPVVLACALLWNKRVLKLIRKMRTS